MIIYHEHIVKVEIKSWGISSIDWILETSFLRVGIPKNEYDNVMKPFYKIDKGRGDSKSSVGLGLSIASDIIRSHGGN